MMVQDVMYSPGYDLAGRVSGPLKAGAVISLVFLATIFGWAAFAPISGGVSAAGIVSPEGSRRIVQHLEGGIVSAILVEEGEVVREGEVLLQLAGTQARARHLILLDRERQIRATLMRLEHEMAGRSEWDPVATLDANTEDRDAWLGNLNGQISIFQQRLAMHQNRDAALDQRIERLNAEIDGLQAQIDLQDEHIAMLGEEIETTRSLYERGLVPRPRLVALRRDENRLEEARAANRAEIARAERLISETRTERLALRAERQESIAAEQARLRSELSEIRERLVASRDALDRSTLRAPIAGTVFNLRSVTPGGVIQAGEAVLDIVPMNEDLVVIARVPPIQVDSVTEGQDVIVRFPGLPRASAVRLTGRVVSISADAVSDDQTAEPYFEVRVRVPGDDLEAAFETASALRPGIPAEVLITTRERSVLAYLLEPFNQTLERALREE